MHEEIQAYLSNWQAAGSWVRLEFRAWMFVARLCLVGWALHSHRLFLEVRSSLT